MSVYEIVTIGMFLLSGGASLLAFLVSALVAALWGVARSRDKEVQTRLELLETKERASNAVLARIEERLDTVVRLVEESLGRPLRPTKRR